MVMSDISIVYPYSEPVIFRNAREIQTLSFSVAMARECKRLNLIFARGGSIDDKEILSYYSLNRPEGLSLSFIPRDIRCLGRRILTANILFNTLLLRHLKYIKQRRRFFIYTRHLKVAKFLLSRKVGIPLIYEVHEIFSDTFRESGSGRSKKYKRLEERESYVLKKADGIVTITAGLARIIKDRFMRDRNILVAPDGVFMEDFPEKGYPFRVDGTIFYGGSLYPWKGVDILVKAMRFLPERRLTIVGGNDRDLSRLEVLAQREGVKERCTFIPRMGRKEYLKSLAESYLCVIPNRDTSISRYFTSPLKLFEFMAAGKPIVASRLESIQEILNKEEGLYVEPEDPESLAKGIDFLYRNPEIAKKMGERCREKVISYTWEERARKIKDFLIGIAPVT